MGAASRHLIIQNYGSLETLRKLAGVHQKLLILLFYEQKTEN